jgi:hypothetical protein
MCWLELSIAVIFSGYCGYMRHIDKREIGYLERMNVRLSEHVKLLKDDLVMDGIRSKADGLKGNPGYAEEVRYDETVNSK